ncbi:DUF6320 domain-containing protein [Hydrogenoanaerobacterium sp.]|uniref:DUF6320 domain-containing protein n=1 Tax=Hydrogenoanaerobacterium sp. TaxID=2953763 RepID=UPI00289B3B64|nr:DUF6320 domain-containing protein [Hydrogenoanaerobacterium sp.]
MKYCENCKVTIQNDLRCCPLCDSELSPRDERFERDFPTAPATPEAKKFTKLLIFLSVVVVTACVIIDIFTSKTMHWSVIVAVGLLYLWLSIRFIKKSRRNIGLLALIQIFGISFLSFAIDSATGYYQWSTNYVIPFVLISAAGLMSVVLLFRPKRFRDYILYQLGISVLGIVVSLVSLFSKSTVAWTSIVGAAYSGLTILGIIFFTARKTRHELKKRFHF